MNLNKMKIAIFGGTFNPVHNGHLHFCEQCQSICHFDKILLVPTNIPPHKPSKSLVSNEDRLNMLKLATKNNSLIEVSDIEYTLGGTSYTYNTIKAIEKIYNNSELFLLIGSDMFRIFDTWYNYNEILNSVTVVVGARETSEYEQLIQLKQTKFLSNDKIHIVNIDVYEMSSTEIRQAILNKLSIENYLNPNVLSYIKKYNLYMNYIEDEK